MWQLLIKLDHIVFTLALSLFVWLIDGDDYLLIFWQIHGEGSYIRSPVLYALVATGCRASAHAAQTHSMHTHLLTIIVH